MLGARVADALSLAAHRENRAARGHLEGLVEDRFAKRERRGRTLAEFGSPALGIGDDLVDRYDAIGDAEPQRFLSFHLAA